MKFRFVIINFLVAILFVGCGYKPTSNFVKKSIANTVFVDVKIDIKNLNNSILIKDALINMLSSKLDINIVTDRSLASSIVYGELRSVSEAIMETDSHGYANKYRETVTIFVSYIDQNKKTKNVTVSNYYDFIVAPDSVVSQSKRDEAITIAITNALSDVFAKIAISSL
ncbi:MAG: hypothetical protein HY307_03835 [Arcobacter sp.]|nr:hypothetical protein [Arcobacter sp.]